jgi:hypothetical protein
VKDFTNLIKGGADSLPPELKFFYSSKSRFHALRDCLLFFPSFFSLNINSFVMTSPQNRVANDTFKDLLDFNNYSVLKEDFHGIQSEALNKAFGFINDAARFV